MDKYTFTKQQIEEALDSEPTGIMRTIWEDGGSISKEWVRSRIHDNRESAIERWSDRDVLNPYQTIRPMFRILAARMNTTIGRMDKDVLHRLHDYLDRKKQYLREYSILMTFGDKMQRRLMATANLSMYTSSKED